MSVWTYVSGSVNLEVDDQQVETLKSELQDKLGNEWSLDDQTHRNTSTLPSGSEGSLEYLILHDEVKHVVTIEVLGNLRDYDDRHVETDLKSWITDLIESLSNVKSFNFTFSYKSGYADVSSIEELNSIFEEN